MASESAPVSSIRTTWADCWRLRQGTVYLNHGSFGPPPEPVRQARLRLLEELDQQPMEFFVRRLEPLLRQARRRLAEFVGADEQGIVFVENATAAMNLVAANVPLRSGDEVLLTDHEYGAVQRIWERACLRADAHPIVAALPRTFESVEETVDAIFRRVSSRTRLIVVSHITSPTAVILPVAEICRRAAALGIAVCIDGPHAVAQEKLDLGSLGCGYYAASCHKWLSAPFGSGFLYVHPSRRAGFSPAMLSWGRLLPSRPESWDEEFLWSGTRDPTSFLCVPAAIDFLEQVGLARFRQHSHELARQAGRRLCDVTGSEPFVGDSRQWFGAMACAPLPPGDAQRLQSALWEEYGIEVPVVAFQGRRHVRVSCHLYNSDSDVDRLVSAITALLRRGL